MTFNAAQRQLLLNLHNGYRNQVASGGLSGFLPAYRMAQVTWSDEMAWLAELNTKQCAMVRKKKTVLELLIIFIILQAHDACRNTRE